jgi:hypothetical protein
LDLSCKKCSKTGENMRKFHLTTTATIQLFAAAVFLIAVTQSAFARTNTGVRPTSAGQSQPFGVKPGATKGVGADGGGMSGGSGGAPARANRPHRQWPTVSR